VEENSILRYNLYFSLHTNNFQTHSLSLDVRDYCLCLRRLPPNSVSSGKYFYEMRKMSFKVFFYRTRVLAAHMADECVYIFPHFTLSHSLLNLNGHQRVGKMKFSSSYNCRIFFFLSSSHICTYTPVRPVEWMKIKKCDDVLLAKLTRSSASSSSRCKRDAINF
jgi:hypothetical protein